VSEAQAARVSPLGGREGLAREVERLRAAASERYSEVDLLVAALREHIQDLQRERARLQLQIDRLRDESRRATTRWMWRGLKPPH